jgi:hypothetical protein
MTSNYLNILNRSVVNHSFTDVERTCYRRIDRAHHSRAEKIHMIMSAYICKWNKWSMSAVFYEWRMKV